MGRRKVSGAVVTPAGGLAGRSDEELADLLAERPDLASPPPASLAGLETRMGSWPSISACVEGLDRFRRQLAEALALADGSTHADMAAFLGVDDEPGRGAVAQGLRRLELLGLVRSGSDGRFHLLDVVRRALPRPAGLGPPLAAMLGAQPRALVDAIAANIGVVAPRGAKPVKADAVAAVAAALADPERVGALLRGAPPTAAALVRKMAERQAPCRVSGNLYWYGQPPNTDAEWLVSRGLMVVIDYGRAELPLEVGLALRGGRPFPDLAVAPPPVAHGPIEPHIHGAASAEAARSILERSAALLAEWAARPASTLKAGGVGIRDLRRAAKACRLDERSVAVLAEMCRAAGLLGAAGGDVLPTTAYDAWLGHAPAERWLTLVRGWLQVDRWPSLAGCEDSRGKTIPALHPADRSALAVAQRSDVMRALADLDEGTAAEAADLVARLLWERPGRWAAGPSHPEELVRWILTEAALLGVTGAGALTSAGRHLLAGDGEAAARAALVLLGSPARSFILQADLTAVAPANLDPSLAAELALAADLESSGAATVWRFSADSVRRALDAGRTAEGVIELLAAHAERGVPQPLAYLVADVGRRHGSVRVGAVTSYVRSDDPALLAQALRCRRAATLGLRAIAPTVLVSSAPPARVLDVLRADGLSPVEEGGDGGVVLGAPAPRRAPVPAPAAAQAVPGPAALSRPALLAVVSAMRATLPAPAAVAPPKPPTLDDALDLFATDDDAFVNEIGDIRDLMLAARDTGVPVVIGYSDLGDYVEEVVDVVGLVGEVVHGRRAGTVTALTVPLWTVEWAAPATAVAGAL